MILLDTHTWLWWAGSREFLSSQALLEIQKAKVLGVSSISCWEIAKLVEKKRLRLDRDPRDWILSALALPKVQSLSLSSKIAVDSVLDLLDFHADPADRMLVATALHHKIPIITKDRKILDYSQVKAIW